MSDLNPYQAPQPSAALPDSISLQVHIHPREKSRVGYVGLQFGCTWDVEHGLGVMMHNDRVVDLGGGCVILIASRAGGSNQGPLSGSCGQRCYLIGDQTF